MISVFIYFGCMGAQNDLCVYAVMEVVLFTCLFSLICLDGGEVRESEFKG